MPDKNFEKKTDDVDNCVRDYNPVSLDAFLLRVAKLLYSRKFRQEFNFVTFVKAIFD